MAGVDFGPDARTDPASPQAARIRVEVVYAPADAPLDLTLLDLPLGSTLAQALAASGVLVRQGIGPERLATGIWGRRAPQRTVLRDGDRVELYRPLLCDPKEARRQRQRRQRSLRAPAAAGGTSAR